MNIIFHHPLPLNFDAKSASGIRPVQMLRAFENLGYEIDLVTGYAHERREKIREIKNKIRNGKKYEFVYSESSTMPTALTDPHHLPLHPWLDFSFFKFLKSHHIPIGLFYRDIYWMFESYGSNMPRYKRLLATWFYRFDLRQYDKYLSKLFLPSLEMGDYIPKRLANRVTALPPGHNDASTGTEQISNATSLQILYVGGLSDHYQMQDFVEALREVPEAKFTLCTREQEWRSNKHKYGTLPENMTVVHKSGAELDELYNSTDVTFLAVKPSTYWQFAAPVKLFEYIGRSKPIIASTSTLAAKMIAENDIGWVVDYNHQTLVEALRFLLNSPDEIRQKALHCSKITQNHTWAMRARYVEQSLKTRI